MRSVKILEMLNEGKIDELKTELRSEIYEDSLKVKPNAKVSLIFLSQTPGLWH